MHLKAFVEDTAYLFKMLQNLEFWFNHILLFFLNIMKMKNQKFPKVNMEIKEEFGKSGNTNKIFSKGKYDLKFF